jgi:hypothetical protein
LKQPAALITGASLSTHHLWTDQWMIGILAYLARLFPSRQSSNDSPYRTTAHRLVRGEQKS